MIELNRTNGRKTLTCVTCLLTWHNMKYVAMTPVSLPKMFKMELIKPLDLAFSFYRNTRGRINRLNDTKTEQSVKSRTTDILCKEACPTHAHAWVCTHNSGSREMKETYQPNPMCEPWLDLSSIKPPKVYIFLVSLRPSILKLESF